MRLKVFAVLLTAVLSIAVAPGNAAERTLRVATSVPHNHYLTRVIKEFAANVSKRTNGGLAFEFYDSGSLVSDQHMDEAVANGTIDIGIASASILAGTVPALNVFAVPFYFDKREKLDRSVLPGMPIRAMLDERINETGSRALFWIPYGFITMITRDKEVHTPADMSGLKIRTFGSTVSEFVEALDAAPVVTSGSEQFLALQRGIVDGGLTGWPSVEERRLFEVSRYVIATDHMYETHFALMSEKTLDDMPTELRDIFREEAAKLETVLMDRIFDATRHTRDVLATKMTIVDLTPEEVAAWKEKTAPVAKTFYENGDELARAVFREAKKIQ
ncbi:TRAP transporter substrate-binding protein DctP [Rhizobium sp. TRM96647]|uniref:TRAP transporter substrate-binding protein n=1 Tax=unclassified Rhizobium TaxID=2613769 RepID=UPI0021E7DC65|nr:MULTISPECIES: TRAP transporter substrate-binding protein DctP [unclassified Rhizobium]MCV3736183.1 TRAP transporter substrate-binding protein DctP [Rhizobium sp. TRM96647]MCV3758155.1 TRAP transporter substrate-binding protein DctP [Rhizobium sp. TRM96650]